MRRAGRKPKLIFVFCVIAAAFAGPARADEPSRTVYAPGPDFHYLGDVRVQPLGLLFGIFGVNVDVRLTRHLELGPSFSWFGADSSGRTGNVTAIQYGLNATYFWWRSGNDGFLVRGSLGYLPVETDSAARTTTVANFTVASVLGYRWVWLAGFNVSLGAGIAYHHSHTGPGAGNVSELQPETEWSVGWLF